MRSVTVHQVDVFTRDPFAGNPAGVVPDPGDLTDGDMQRIARELNNSETVFVCGGSGDELRFRYFTPLTEVPYCGHATLAAHFVRRVTGADETDRVPFLTGSGAMTAHVRVDADGGVYTAVEQRPFEIREDADPALRRSILTALGVGDRDVDPRCPVQLATAGHAKWMVGLKSRDTLYRLVPDQEVLREIGRASSCPGFFVFTLDSGVPDTLVESRTFAPAIGIPEDPVNGSGHGVLGGYLAHHRVVPHTPPSITFIGAQGHHLDRAGRVEVTVDVRSGTPGIVTVGGYCVEVFRTAMRVGDPVQSRAR